MSDVAKSNVVVPNVELCVESQRRIIEPAALPGGRPSSNFLARLAGWGLTTAEILYRMPDHPKLLQTFVWQDYDLAPHFPTLKRFLAFWQETLEGPLFSVRVGHDQLLRPAEIRAVGREFRIH